MELKSEKLYSMSCNNKKVMTLVDHKVFKKKLLPDCFIKCSNKKKYFRNTLNLLR